MPIPAPVLDPPFNIVRLSHVVLTVTDLQASRAFYVDTLGLQVTDETSGAIYLRAMEERGHHCIVLRKATTPEARDLGFKVFSDEDLDKAEHFFKAKGLPVEWVERPYQSRTFRTRDPHGIPLEFYAQMERLPPIHQKYALYRGVKPLRIDHFNCFSPNVDESVAFYNELGFRVTEYTEDASSGKLWAAWTHRKGGVHDIAFTNGLGPRLHHVAFWVPTPLNIIDLLDLMATTGWVGNIERGPGRQRRIEIARSHGRLAASATTHRRHRSSCCTRRCRGRRRGTLAIRRSFGEHTVGGRKQRADPQVDEIDVGEPQHDLRIDGESLVDDRVDHVEQRLRLEACHVGTRGSSLPARCPGHGLVSDWSGDHRD